jgi:hypothetical protein
VGNALELVNLDPGAVAGYFRSLMVVERDESYTRWYSNEGKAIAGTALLHIPRPGRLESMPRAKTRQTGEFGGTRLRHGFTTTRIFWAGSIVFMKTIEFFESGLPMTDRLLNTPPVVSPEEWETARRQLLAKEKASTHARDALAA